MLSSNDTKPKQQQLDDDWTGVDDNWTMDGFFWTRYNILVAAYPFWWVDPFSVKTKRNRAGTRSLFLEVGCKDRPKDSSLPNEDERTKKGNERKKDNKRIVSKPILLLGHFLLQRKNTSLFWPLGLFSLELENSNVPRSGSYL